MQVLLPQGRCHPPWPAEIASHVSGVEQYLLNLGLNGTWKLQSNSPLSPDFVNKSNTCIFSRGEGCCPSRGGTGSYLAGQSCVPSAAGR